MAQKHKTFKRQAEATRLLKTLNATRRKSGHAGITVTGEFKKNLIGRQSQDVIEALKYTANTAMDEAENLYYKILETSETIDDKITLKQMQDYLEKYGEHIKSTDKSIQDNYRSLRVANRLESLFNYSDVAYKILRNPTRYFEDKRYATISAVMNNLLGTYKKDIPPNDLKKLVRLGDKLGLNTTEEMNRAWSDWDTLLRNSDQFSEVLTDATNKLRAIVEKAGKKFVKENKADYKEFTELASKYGLW